ncbi:Gibberellin 2-beta-dioxygenase [Dichanthelium oligosanthes]|uniref:gibberellin 2beta-dioxygenase n=1 Tax=Dichanthelium oligosanthes TaxID=888268 RepID=A0A1E5V2C0_9POAL|nr:Gibberellin 2-beta-dioxygenase [Dichanthelium oligosanthes]
MTALATATSCCPNVSVEPAAAVLGRAAVPVVDLSSPGSAGAVASACGRLGFFKAVNHGIPVGLVEKLEAEALAFFSLPQNDKLLTSGAPLGYGHRKIGPNGDVGMLEFLMLSIGSNSVTTSALPTVLCYMLAEYMSRVQKVALRVLELMAEGLGMSDTNVFSRMVQRDGSDVLLRVNHYPVAMRQPAGGGRGAVGFGEHTDPQIIAVLRSNSASGLQIALRDGSWVPVEPDPESFFVNVGDSMQVLTNGRYRSVRHRVVVEAGEWARARLSMIYFGAPAPSERIAPVPELIGKGEASRYRSFTWREYKAAAYKSRLADRRLDGFQLDAQGSPDDET